jgi:hypothetical protein
LRQLSAVLCMAAFSLSATMAFAQSGGNSKPPEQQKSPADIAKESRQKIDEIAEASRILTGPAGNPECVWLGKRAVNRLSQDDMDTAFRHLDLYDRFGCPSAHIQATFRCVVRQGDTKAETLVARIDACWLNPGLPPTPAADASAAPAATSGGTTPR